jgi:ferritin-like metal-binding protein YciE
MGWFSSDIKSVDDLFAHGMHDIYYAEQQIEKALPTMIEKTSDSELKKGFNMHLRQTKGQIKRLERAFKSLKMSPEQTKCPAIDGIIDEANEIASEVDDKMVLNAALIAAAQAVEHYEITRYGALIAWAKELGHRHDVPLLTRTLNEEKATDKKLTALAERRINPRSEKGTARGGHARRRASRSSNRAAASRRKTGSKAGGKKKASARRA